MAFTPKQERQGTDIGDGTRETGATSWMAQVDGMRQTAESAADTYAGYGHTIFTGQSQVTTDLTLGNTWDWDDVIAVAETPGEWSQPGVHANSSPNANTPSNVTGTIDGTPNWVSGS